MDATPIIIKKKKAHHAGHHGGSWKVAYADFVTAMMAFFMVMWIMGLSDDAKASIQGYFNDPVGFVKNQPKSKSMITIPGNIKPKPGNSTGEPYEQDHKAMKELKQNLEEALKATPEFEKFLEHIDIEITDEGLRIEFLEDKEDFFESGQAVLRTSAIKLINALGPKLAEANRTVSVEGHTDSVPFAGDRAGNFGLSTKRALALQAALIGTGVTKFKSVTGLADQQLRDADHPTSSVNRRVTLLLPYVAPITASEPMPKDEIANLIKNAIKPETHLEPGNVNVVHNKK
jgi:chemotaxis protein MotB